MEGEGTPVKAAESGKLLPIPPSEEAMDGLSDAELSGLLGACVSAQHRRVGPEGRKRRTAAARAAKRAERSLDSRRAQTAAATAARKAKRRK